MGRKNELRKPKCRPARWMARNTPNRPRRRSWAAACAAVLLAATVAAAQTGYTFTSGPTGDGFNWPASPTGLLDTFSFSTPDGVEFYNDTGNNVFFDSQHQVVGNSSRISGDALWGNPNFSGFGTFDVYLFSYGSPQTVAFDFAWAVAGAPDATPVEVYVYVEDSEGRASEVVFFLGESFTGFGGVDGYADRLLLDANSLFDDFFNVDGEQYIDIAYLYIYVGDIATGGPASEFAIDHFDVDGGLGGGNVFPSVNGGTIDVTGATLGHSVLQGSGTYGVGLEVTNGGAIDTTYSTQRVPGGGLSDAGQVSHAPILSGETVYSGNILSLDRALPSASYESDIVVINEESASDPDDTVTLLVRLVEPPQLTAPSPVDVTAGQKTQLSNAAAPASGHRASVKVTGTSTTGPFTVSGYDVGTAVKPGETTEGNAAFHRHGLLSGLHTGTFDAFLAMTFFVGVNNDFETFLVDAEPLADQQWTLEAALADTPTDSAAFAAAGPLGPGVVGVNSTSTAATILAGTAATAGAVTLTQIAGVLGTTTGVIEDAVNTDFTTAAPAHVVQMAYRDADVCPAATETALRLLYFNSSATDWHLSVNGNSDGGAGAAFFAGSFDDFAATLGGAPLAGALGTHGVDTLGNHVWAVVDHEATFGVGEIGRMCGMLGDLDNDGDVDLDDHTLWSTCLTGPAATVTSGCMDADLDGDGDADLSDHAIFARLFSGQ